MLCTLSFTKYISFHFSQLYLIKSIFLLQFMNINILSEHACTTFLRENNAMIPKQFKNYLLCAVPSTGKLDIDKVNNFILI